MTLEDFDLLLDGFGADPAAWPADRRDAARALVSTDPEAARRLHATRMLDAALADLPRETASPALRRAVLDIPLDAPRTAPPVGLLARFGREAAATWRAWSAGAVAASAAMVMGLYLGYGGLLHLPGLTEETISATTTAAASPEQELSDLVSAINTDSLP